jgi:hypothetical protein
VDNKKEMKRFDKLTVQEKEEMRLEWRLQIEVDKKYRSDIYVRGTGVVRCHATDGNYEEGFLCIKDKGVEWNIIGVNSEGTWRGVKTNK